MAKMAPVKLHRSQAETAARRTRTQFTRSLALILPDVLNPFFAELTHGLDEVVADAGFALMTCSSAGDTERERAYLNAVLGLGVEGVAIIPAGIAQPAVRLIAEQGVAVVVLDRDLPGIPADCIFCDNEAGAFLAVNHLIALGHRRIGCVAGPPQNYPGETRLSGYHAALRAASIPYDPALILAGDFQDASGSIAARRLLEAPNPPTAIFACNDLMALGVLRGARAMGLLLPQDLSVVGFDGIHLTTLTEPQLTTVEQPKNEYGRQAGRMLLDRMADPALPYRRTMLPTRLCVRASTAPPG